MDVPMLIGLDCETTGPIPGRHNLVQIGLCLPSEERFFSPVGWRTFEAEPEALQIIRMSEDDIRQAPFAPYAERDLIVWCAARGVSENSLVPVGWDVSGFDLPFVRLTFPDFSKRFLSQQAVELNTVCHALAGVKRYHDAPRDFDFWKRAAKRAAEFDALARLGIAAAWHHAAYDALTSLLAFEWLRKVIDHPAPASTRFKAANDSP
jgi:DNA polymerase III epsilon subunit-like protein